MDVDVAGVRFDAADLLVLFLSLLSLLSQLNGDVLLTAPVILAAPLAALCDDARPNLFVIDLCLDAAGDHRGGDRLRAASPAGQLCARVQRRVPLGLSEEEELCVSKEARHPDDPVRDCLGCCCRDDSLCE